METQKETEPICCPPFDPKPGMTRSLHGKTKNSSATKYLQFFICLLTSGGSWNGWIKYLKKLVLLFRIQLPCRIIPQNGTWICISQSIRIFRELKIRLSVENFIAKFMKGHSRTQENGVRISKVWQNQKVLPLQKSTCGTQPAQIARKNMGRIMSWSWQRSIKGFENSAIWKFGNDPVN